MAAAITQLMSTNTNTHRGRLAPGSHLEASLKTILLSHFVDLKKKIQQHVADQFNKRLE